jgi:hypothetical protein
LTLATKAEVVISFAEVELSQGKTELVVARGLVDHGRWKLLSLFKLEV